MAHCRRLLQVCGTIQVSVLCALLTTSGCQQSSGDSPPRPAGPPAGPPKPAIHGPVSYEDKPVYFGMVQLYDGERVVAQGPILPETGEYWMEAPPAGRYRVCVSIKPVPKELLQPPNAGPPQPPSGREGPLPNPGGPPVAGPGPRPGPGPLGSPGGRGPRMFPPGFLPPLPDEERKRYELIDEKYGTPEKSPLDCDVQGGEQVFPLKLE